MAEAEDTSKSDDSAEGKAVHQSLLQRFKDEPKWVKIGSLAGVAVLGITVLLYFKNQGSAAGATTTGDTTNGQGASTEMPGEGDIYPSLPTTGSAGTSTAGSTGASSSPTSTSSAPTKIKATPRRGSAPITTGLLAGGSPPRGTAKPKPKTYALNSAIPGRVSGTALKQVQAQKMLSGVSRNIGGGPSRQAPAQAQGIMGSFWRV